MSEQDPTTPHGSPRPPIDPAGTSAPPPPPAGYVPAVYVQQPTASNGIGKIVTYLLVVGLLVSVTINIYLFGPVAVLLSSLSRDAPPENDFYPVFDESGDKERIVVVEISGGIDADMADYARKVFYTLEKDPPAAVVIRVESGGGGVTASDQIWQAIQSFRAKHDEVPVIASFGSVAASGGYYIAAPADRIFCERTGITGSIGVLAQLPAFGGMIEKLGVEMNMVIASQSSKKDDANNLFISWYAADDTDDADVVPIEVNGETRRFTKDGAASYKVLQNLVDGAYVTFFNVVKEGRLAANSKITEEELRQAANGSIFVGQAALDAKLVDEIGYLEDAIAYAAKEAKITGDPKVKVIKKPTPGFFGAMAKRGAGVDLTDFTGADLRGLYEDATTLRLEYRLRAVR